MFQYGIFIISLKYRYISIYVIDKNLRLHGTGSSKPFVYSLKFHIFVAIDSGPALVNRVIQVTIQMDILSEIIWTIFLSTNSCLNVCSIRVRVYKRKLFY